MKKPCPSLKLVDRSRKRCAMCRSLVDDRLKIFDLLVRGLPFSGKDVGCEFAPMSGHAQFDGWREDQEVVKEIRSGGVCAESVLVLAEMIQCVDLFSVDLRDESAKRPDNARSHIIVCLEKLEISFSVSSTPQFLNSFGIFDHLHHRLRLLL